ncbi:MAG: hypothetical protein NT141_01830 [candidate division WWE3 bacterium]|nr:hypothetical protein [candidate division WWE3 bacterium]
MSTQENYAKKNARVLSALQSGQPYWLLKAEQEYYSLVQVGPDRLPIPILKQLLGNEHGDLITLIGREPELTFDRDMRVANQNGLLREIVGIMLASIEADPSHKGEWEVTYNGLKGRITTEFSNRPEYSSNGGEYFFYRKFRITVAGVTSFDDWSCDFSDYQNPGQLLYRIDLTSLQPIFDHAELIAKAVIAGEWNSVCSVCGHVYTHTQEA